MKILLQLVLVALIGIAAVAADRDPCDLRVLPGRDFWAGPIKPLQRCFENVPFDQQQARQAAYLLSQVASMYSFSDIVSNSGAPWNLTVDLRGQIKQLQVKVESGVYPNDYSFHADALSIFNQVYDAHTQYRLPTGYLNGTFVRPLSVRRLNDGTFVTAQGPLGDMGDDLYKQLFGIDLKPYVGGVISLIDNTPVLRYFAMASDKFFTQYKDRNVRFNALIRQKGWAFVPLQHFSLDIFSPSTLYNGLELPNFMYYPGGLNSTAQLMQRNNCTNFCMNTTFNLASVKAFSDGPVALPPAGLKMKKIQPKPINPHDEHNQIFDSIIKSLKKSAPKTQKIASTTSAAVSNLKILRRDNFNETQFAVMVDSTTGGYIPVLRMRTFLPRDLNGSIDTIFAFIDWGRMMNAENAIVDVAHNGGGIICLSDLLLAALARPWANLNVTGNRTPAYGVYDMRHSPITDLIIQSSFYQPQFLNGSVYLNLETRQTYGETNTTWYNGPTYARGNFRSQYSIKNYFPNECEDYAAKLMARPNYFFPKLTVITDGTCGSACALFTAQLLAHRDSFSGQQIKMVSFCGLDNSAPMDTASFAGGNVLDTSALAEIFSQTGYNDTRLPIQFPTSAIARFNFHEYYTTADATVPREFTRIPADIHTPMYCDALWNDDFSTEFGLTASYNLYLYSLKASRQQ